MKKIYKNFLAILLAIFCMSTTVFAKVDLNIKVDGQEITIEGSSDHKSEKVMIQTWSGDRKYYIDAGNTDSYGKFEFKFKTEKNLDYDGKVNVGGELKEFTFNTKNPSGEVKVDGIALNKNSLQLEVGKTEKLIVTVSPEDATNKKVKWKSSDSNIATVNEYGEVKGLKEGKTNITVTSEEGNKTAVCAITVVKGSGIGEGGNPDPNKPEDEGVTVNIRVEGYDRTLISKTTVKAKVFNLNPYLRPGTGSTSKPSTGWDVNKFSQPTHAHAIVQTLIDHGYEPGSDYDFQDYGWSLYMAMIGGDREFDQGEMSGWMYSVNGKLPPVGANGRTLNEGDDVLWFYGAEGFDTIVTKLSSNKSNVKTGEEISLDLEGYTTTGAGGTGTVGDYGQNKIKVKDATVLVNGEEYEINDKIVKTDANGKATIKFNEPGSYTLSVIRYNDKSKIDIVRPEPVRINVTGEVIETIEDKDKKEQKAKEKEEKALKELQEKLKTISIGEHEVSIQKLEDKQVASVYEAIIFAKISQAQKAIDEIKVKYKDVKLSDDVKVIPIIINEDNNLNTVFALKGNTINHLNATNFKLNICFKDTEVKISPKDIGKTKWNETIEIRKNNVKKDVQDKIINSLSIENKIASGVYNVSLYKVSEDYKSEEKLNLKGTAISLSLSPEEVKNLSKNSLKINFYNKDSKKWTKINTIYNSEKGMVTGIIK